MRLFRGVVCTCAEVGQEGVAGADSKGLAPNSGTTVFANAGTAKLPPHFLH
jgi:hypothetical protein